MPYSLYPIPLTVAHAAASPARGEATRKSNILKDHGYIIQSGGIIAYPTEAVYGLGGDPFNFQTVQRIQQLKGRSPNQRFILIASDWEQIEPLIGALDESLLKPVRTSWPGPVTWVFPAASSIPSWLVSPQNTIALRITNHPIARNLCETAQTPILSTSANISGQPPCRSYEETLKIFAGKVDRVIEGPTGGHLKPTPIYDVLTGKCLREG